MDEPLGAGLEETPDSHGAFPHLEQAQIEQLRALGTVRDVEAGDILYREGDADYDFFVIDAGYVTMVQGYGSENRVFAVHGPGRFLGELGLITGQRAVLTAVVRDQGRVIQVPAQTLRQIVIRDAKLGNLILSAYVQRRSLLIESGTGPKLIGSRFSPDSRRLREFLARNRLPFEWIDLEENPDAEALLEGFGIAPAETPVVIWPGGEVLRNPTNAELAAAIGLGTPGPLPAVCDLIVVGGGPAGLSASLYGASEGLDTQAVEQIALGGQASTSSRIENYLGFPAGISGAELAERAAIQAKKFGARLTVPAAAAGLERDDDGLHVIQLGGAGTVSGRTVIIATGAQYRRLDVPGIDRFESNVHHAATEAEARLCFGDPIVIVGGGNSAGQAAVFLCRRSTGCTLVAREDELEASMSRYLIDQIEASDLIDVKTHSEVAELKGDMALESVDVIDAHTGEREEIPCKALFVFIGAEPHTEWLQGQLAVDSEGFIYTGRDVQGDDVAEYPAGDRPFFLETSRPGIFAAGDVHSGSIKRVASAVGEGSMAVRLVHQRLGTLPGTVMPDLAHHAEPAPTA